MPPKNKFSKEQIIDAAFNIAKEEGIDQITIRKVASQLGSSIAPIYVNFTDVDELKKAVLMKIHSLSLHMLAIQHSPNPFLNVGIASLKFARDYPQLFLDLLNNQHYLAEVQPDLSHFLEQMQQAPSLEGFTRDELMEFMFKMQAFQLGLSMMEVKGMLPPQMDEERLIQLLEGTGSDIIIAMKLRQQK